MTTARVRMTAGAAVLAFGALCVSPVSIAGADDKVALGRRRGHRGQRRHLLHADQPSATTTPVRSSASPPRIAAAPARRSPPESNPDNGVVGTMVAGNDGLDYAVIRFDPAKVQPVANYKGFLIDGIGPDPTFGQVACKLGRTTGYSCGVTWGPGQDPGTIVNQVCGQPGDSGAPVTVNNKLVGMIHGAFSEDLPTCVIKFIPLHTPR